MTSERPAEVRMVNQIATHFGYLSSEAAAAAVANHLTRFWDPRMKRRLREVVADDAGAVDPVVVAALALLQ